MCTQTTLWGRAESLGQCSDDSRKEISSYRRGEQSVLGFPFSINGVSVCNENVQIPRMAEVCISSLAEFFILELDQYKSNFSILSWSLNTVGIALA